MSDRRSKRFREAEQMIAAWCAEHGKKLVGRLHHVQPRAYVVGLAGSRCLIVAEPWVDAEPHMQKHEREHPLRTVHVFDPTLKAGDWCMTAYVSTESSGEPVAVSFDWRPKKTKRR